MSTRRQVPTIAARSPIPGSRACTPGAQRSTSMRPMPSIGCGRAPYRPTPYRLKLSTSSKGTASSGAASGPITTPCISNTGRNWCTLLPLGRSGRPYHVDISLESLVEPDVLHTPIIKDAVLHQGQTLDLRLPAGALSHEEDDRAHRILDQLALDLPDQLLALRRIGFRRLPVDQRIHLGVAAGIIAGRPARVILVELRVGVVDGAPRKAQSHR